MTASSRIEDLRRRVDRDPASIAFAQLAEEHRRSRDFEAAVRVARAGLVHLPGFLSARVTLGRALLQLGRVEDARRELEAVLTAAPDNLAAIRTLEELRHHGPAMAAGMPAFPAAADALAGDLATTFAETGDEIAAPLAGRFVVTGDATEAAGLAPLRVQPLDQFAADDPPTPEGRAAAALERWLAAILADRATRG